MGAAAAKMREFDHGRILIRPLAALRPAPQNDALYRPILSDDPEIVALAESIRVHGLREPLVVTIDNYILSGHRRSVACGLAGLTSVPCRVEPISSDDPEFVPLLREHNRQRVKTIDEMVREEVVTANPEEAYRSLIAHRKHKSKVHHVDAIEIEGSKHRAEITPAKKLLLDAAIAVIDERRDYWPLTDRGIHYALLDAPPLRHASKPHSRYTNDHHSYKDLCDLLARARLVGLVPWEAIDDPTRPVVTWDVYASAAPFIQKEVSGFLKGYWRNLQQSQPNHIEIVGEKNTIDNIIRPVAEQYCIPMTIGRGYSSLPPRRDMNKRFRRSGKERLVILVLSDFDPEGEDIAHSFARSMRDDFAIEQVTAIRVALTAEQVREMKLPPMLKAKAGSSRREKFVERHGGDDVFELDAIKPKRLQEILRKSIDGILDVEAFNRELDEEKADAARLASIRRAVQKMLVSVIGPHAGSADDE